MMNKFGWMMLVAMVSAAGVQGVGAGREVARVQRKQSARAQQAVSLGALACLAVAEEPEQPPRGVGGRRHGGARE